MTTSEPSGLPDPSRPAFLPPDSGLVRRETRRRSSVSMAWQMPAFGVALTALILVVIALFPKASSIGTPPEVLHAIEQRLNLKQHEAAEDLAAAFLKTLDEASAEAGMAHFYLGRALREPTLDADVPRAEALEEAVLHFDRATERPIPADARDLALLWAGECLERLKRPAQAAQRYEKGLAASGEASGALRLALVRVLTGAERPDLARIEEHLAPALADGRLTDEQKALVLLAAGRAAYRAEKWEVAKERFGRVLSAFPNAAGTNPAHLYLARLAHRSGDVAASLLAARRYLDARPDSDREALAAAYLVAEGLLQTQQPAEALPAFEQLARDFPSSAEGQAAALKCVACLVRLERGADALDRLKAVLADRPAETWSENPWMPHGDVTALLDDLHRFLFLRSEYARVLELAEVSRPLISTRRYLETLTAAYPLMGDEAERTAEQGGAEAPAWRERARLAFIRAGDAFLRLADETRTELASVERVWSAAEQYRRGRAYEREAAALERYSAEAFTPTAPEGPRYAQAHYALAECYAALGRTADARDLFDRVVCSHPRNPHGYLARLASAECSISLHDLDAAEQGLTAIVDNTEGDIFTPESAIWQKAIFLLGQVLHRQGKYAEARRRLTEALERRPDDPEASRGRYLLAEGHRSAALAMNEAIWKESSASAAASLRDRQRAEYEAALAGYRDLLTFYAARKAAGAPLDALDQTQECNALFFIGSCYFEMGEYAQSIAAYERAAARYQGDPRSLNAFVQMAEALRRERQEVAARTAVEKARWILRQAPGNDLDKQPAGMTREQWTAWLDWAERRE
jgi:tetratricopeptide (TPR) repeat protein